MSVASLEDAPICLFSASLCGLCPCRAFRLNLGTSSKCVIIVNCNTIGPHCAVQLPKQTRDIRILERTPTNLLTPCPVLAETTIPFTGIRIAPPRSIATSSIGILLLDYQETDCEEPGLTSEKLETRSQTSRHRILSFTNFTTSTTPPTTTIYNSATLIFHIRHLFILWDKKLLCFLRIHDRVALLCPRQFVENNHSSYETLHAFQTGIISRILKEDLARNSSHDQYG